MADKMLIDASHEEETRVVVVRGNRIEEFDFESQHKKQLRGNIYLAKVTRVEPSLQAAFVEYGGNRHGFLAFSEIHPDYYQIPVADRQALLEADAEEARREDDDDETEKPVKKKTRTRRSRSKARPADDDEATTASATDAAPESETGSDTDSGTDSTDEAGAAETSASAESTESDDGDAKTDTPPESIGADVETDEISENVRKRRPSDDDDDEDEDGSVESVGAEDALEEVPDRGRKLHRIASG